MSFQHALQIDRIVSSFELFYRWLVLIGWYFHVLLISVIKKLLKKQSANTTVAYDSD
jgi:hypothetical protein